MDGIDVGVEDNLKLGIIDGKIVREEVGFLVGFTLGIVDGFVEGIDVGDFEG